jgi:hypothetical protein
VEARFFNKHAAFNDIGLGVVSLDSAGARLVLGRKAVYSDAMSTLVQPASTEPMRWYEEVRRLREINHEQYRMIRQLEGQSLLWESVAETRAELIRNLRAALGLDPDVNHEEEQL